MDLNYRRIRHRIKAPKCVRRIGSHQCPVMTEDNSGGISHLRSSPVFVTIFGVVIGTEAMPQWGSYYRRLKARVPSAAPLFANALSTACPVQGRPHSPTDSARFQLLAPLAATKPALIAFTAAECLNSSIASSTPRNALLNMLEVSVREFGMSKMTLRLTNSLSTRTRCETLPAQPIQTGGQDNRKFPPRTDG
jgi:hypothetical protein